MSRMRSASEPTRSPCCLRDAITRDVKLYQSGRSGSVPDRRIGVLRTCARSSRAIAADSEFDPTAATEVGVERAPGQRPAGFGDGGVSGRISPGMERLVEEANTRANGNGEALQSLTEKLLTAAGRLHFSDGRRVSRRADAPTSPRGVRAVGLSSTRCSTAGYSNNGACGRWPTTFDFPTAAPYVVIAAETPAVGAEPLPDIEPKLRSLDVFSAWWLLPDLQVGIVHVNSDKHREDVLALLSRMSKQRVGVSARFDDLPRHRASTARCAGRDSRPTGPGRAGIRVRRFHTRDRGGERTRGHDQTRCSNAGFLCRNGRRRAGCPVRDLQGVGGKRWITSHHRRTAVLPSQHCAVPIAPNRATNRALADPGRETSPNSAWRWKYTAALCSRILRSQVVVRPSRDCSDCGAQRFVVAFWSSASVAAETRQRPIGGVALPEVGRDRNAITGTGVRSGKHLAARPPVISKHRRGHQLHVRRTLPVAQLAHVIIALVTVRTYVVQPTQQDVAGAPASGAARLPHPLSGVRVAAWRAGSPRAPRAAPL